MDKNHSWAMNQGGLFLDGRGLVWETFRKITRKLKELEIDFAVYDGMALYRYGLHRYIEDIVFCITAQSLESIDCCLTEHGYLPFEAGSRKYRDIETGVKFEFVIAGEFPGDGKPKPVAFPNPKEDREFDGDGIAYLKLKTWIELKLASGMIVRGRLKDLADVQEIIKIHELNGIYAARLNEFVRAKFIELWRGTLPQ